MSVAGACPGMGLVQLGAGVNNSWSTYVGCLLGAAIYALIQPTLSAWASEGWKFQHVNLDAYISPDYQWGGLFGTIASGMGVVCAVLAGLLELIASHDTLGPSGCTVNCTSWYPQLSGAVIGGSQIPLLLF